VFDNDELVEAIDERDCHCEKVLALELLGYEANDEFVEVEKRDCGAGWYTGGCVG
jgi:hypothetical protein